MFCPNCGSEVEENTSFCPNCGASIDGQAPKAEQQPQYQQPQYQQPQYQQPPYQQQVQVQYQQQPAQQSNIYAILGLVFAFLFPIVGLILSIIGLNKAKEMNGEGHGLALAGLIVSIVEMAIVLIAVIVVVATGAAVASQIPSYYY